MPAWHKEEKQGKRGALGKAFVLGHSGLGLSSSGRGQVKFHEDFVISFVT